MSKIVSLFVYWWHLFRLQIKAGAVWGVTETGTMKDWAAEVRATPLKYELEKLEQERIAITGKGF